MSDLSISEIEEIKNTVGVAVGNNIRVVRERVGLSQTDLANKIHSDRQYLYKIEKGKVGISIIKLAVIAKALNVDLSELVKLS